MRLSEKFLKSVHQHFLSISILQSYFFAIFFILFTQRTWYLKFLFPLLFSYALPLLSPTLYSCTQASFTNSKLFFPSLTSTRNRFQSILFFFLYMLKIFNCSVHCCHLHGKYIGSFILFFGFLNNLVRNFHCFMMLFDY